MSLRFRYDRSGSIGDGVEGGRPRRRRRISTICLEDGMIVNCDVVMNLILDLIAAVWAAARSGEKATVPWI